MATDTSQTEVSSEPIVDDSPTAVDKAPKAQKQDDKHPAVVGDAELHDPPLRTPRPDVPVAQRLADGAGQHQPLVEEDVDEQGRYVGEVDGAHGKPGERGAATKAEQDKAAKES